MVRATRSDEPLDIAADIVSRLPAFHRETQGRIVAVLRASSESIRIFGRELPEGATPALPGITRRRVGGTQRELRELLARRTGARPALWPGVRLEPVGESRDADGREKLRVRLEDRRPALVIAWDAESGPGTGGGPGLDFGDRFHPVGLTVQYVELSPLPPRPPRVEGLLLAGKLLEA